jgi:hypothetical protein
MAIVICVYCGDLLNDQYECDNCDYRDDCVRCRIPHKARELDPFDTCPTCKESDAEYSSCPDECMICGCALTKHGVCHECDMREETEDEEVKESEDEDETEDETEEVEEVKESENEDETEDEEVESLPVFWYRIIVAMLARMRE